MQTPAPNPSDSEDVATALETAAIFAARGDTSQAAHFIVRAAESASQLGNASRASELARAAAELADVVTDADLLDASPPQEAPPASTRERRLPGPPPLPTARVSRPPPPSERAHTPSATDSQPMLLVRPATTPSPSAVKPSASTPAPPSAKAPVLTPLSPSVKPSSRPVSAAAVASSLPRPSSTKEHHEESAVRESSARSSAPGKSSEAPRASTPPPLHTETHRPFRLHGARVSIASSQGSTRFYVMKVLEEGEPVPQGEHEAFLVLADPKVSR